MSATTSRHSPRPGNAKHVPQKSISSLRSILKRNESKSKRRSVGKSADTTSVEPFAAITESFKDWPNSEGFDIYHDERTPVELKIKGEIPEYACGVLYRTGPGGYQTKTDTGATFSITHWFDAFAQVHRFEIVSPTKVLYNSRHTCDDLLLNVQKTGKIPSGFTFGQRRDPCQSFFKKFVSIFEPRVDLASKGAQNAAKVNISVTISTDYPGLPETGKGEIKSLYNKTDAAVFQALDPETLEPIGLAKQSGLHPELVGPFSAAHSRTDPQTGDVFNYNLNTGKTPCYKIFKVSASTGKTSILATITDAPAAYIHSFFLTENYVVLCVWNSHYGMNGLKLLYHKNIVDAIDPFDPTKKSKWYVVDRRGDRGVIGCFESEPYFAFHSINAWEENGDIVAEIPAYDGLEVLKKFYIENLKGNEKGAWEWASRGRVRLTRWRLKNVDNGKQPGVATETVIGEVVKDWELSKDESMELPSMNPNFVTKPHRYTYGLLNRVKSSLMDGIVKFDSKNRTSIIWEKHAHTPGECIFIPNPAAPKDIEDDGVLLSVVLDGNAKKSYLLVLDARELKELARAEMETAVGFGFHGKHVRRGGGGINIEY